MKQLHYRQVDVFSQKALSGNGLAVFNNCAGLSSQTMQKIAQEMRQYESIFLFPTNDPQRFKARIFTMEEELDFAGHPILGAACVLHERHKNEATNQKWIFELNAKLVTTTTLKQEKSYLASMQQGTAHFGTPLELPNTLKFLEAFNIPHKAKPEHLPLQVVSTGLPYLIIPVQHGLEKVKILTYDLAAMLAAIDAKFAYILDVSRLEGRTWDNDGRVEDIATGSAAGPAAAYLIRYGIQSLNSEIVINQGRFVGRPSQIFVKVKGAKEHMTSIEVSGEVCMVAQGTFDMLEDET